MQRNLVSANLSLFDKGQKLLLSNLVNNLWLKFILAKNKVNRLQILGGQKSNKS